MGTVEWFFTCPYCLQSVSFILELLHGSQSYIEDCEVCCRPIEVAYEVSGEAEVVSFSVKHQ